MYQHLLNRRFIREHPAEELSAQRLMAVMIESEIFQKLPREFVENDMEEDRKQRIESDRAFIANADQAEEIVDLFRKKSDILARHELVKKALEYEDDVYPLVLKRFMTSSQECFLETAAQFFGRAQKNCVSDLLACYDSIRNPYAQSLACVFFGLRGDESVIPKMFAEYERLLEIDDAEGEDYSEGPLNALHDLYYRFYAK